MNTAKQYVGNEITKTINHLDQRGGLVNEFI